MNKTQESQQKYANQRRRDLEFNTGDHVFLKVNLLKGVFQFRKQGELIRDSSNLSKYSKKLEAELHDYPYLRHYLKSTISSTYPCLGSTSRTLTMSLTLNQ